MNTTRNKKAQKRQQYKTAMIKWCSVADRIGFFSEHNAYLYRDNKPGDIDAGFIRNIDLIRVKSYQKAAKALKHHIYLSHDAWALVDGETGQVYSLKGSYVAVYLPYGIDEVVFNDILRKVDTKTAIKSRDHDWVTLGFDFPKFPPKGIPGLTRIQKHLGRYQLSHNQKTELAIIARERIETGKRRKENLMRDNFHSVYKTSDGTYQSL